MTRPTEKPTYSTDEMENNQDRWRATRSRTARTVASLVALGALAAAMAGQLIEDAERDEDDPGETQ